MTDLISRIERAGAGCRELDLRIKAEIYGGGAMVSPINGEWCLYEAAAGCPRTTKLFRPPFNVPHEIWINDRYTTSIDAALTLVPAGSAYTIGHPGHANSWVYLFPDPEGEAVIGRAATHALAICVAALKARQEDRT